MAKASLLILKVLIILISFGWISIWLLKPTQFWTKKWRSAEEAANTTVFGYNGLDFAVYTFPVIVVAILGLAYIEMKPREPKTRGRRSSFDYFSNPVLVQTCIGVLSIVEIIVIFLFILFLAWTFYVRISNDFKKMKMPGKSFHLSPWQFKFFRIVTRCGLLAEACLALLLLPILRQMSVIRILGIQFEASVKYHIWLGNLMILFATLHGAGTFFIWGIKHRIQDEMWKWQKTNRIYLAGEISLIAGIIIWITSLPQFRRTRFEIFYYTHHLYAVVLLFFLFHGGDRHFYTVFAGIFLFGIDKLIRFIQSRPTTCVLSARLLPSKAVELILPKDQRLKYCPTSVIFLKIPSLSDFQWHAFSVSSSSSMDTDTISVIIKCNGRWTNDLYKLIQSEPDTEADRRKCIHVAVEGPYGPASMDFLRYDSLVLVAGGIGITPFLSILQETAVGNYLPTRIQLIYTVKKREDLSLLSSIVPILQNQKGEKFQLKLKVFVTSQVQSNALTFRELVTEFSQPPTVEFVTESTCHTICGPENLIWTAGITAISSIVFLFFLSLFNNLFLQLDQKTSKQKGPTSVTNLLLLSSFVISLICSTVLSLILRRKNLRNVELSPIYKKQEKGMRRSSTELNRALDEHEIHFGRRPDFEDIFSKFQNEFQNETSGSSIGVYVCGPETMKESVASICKLKKNKKPCFDFHSLNFTL